MNKITIALVLATSLTYGCTSAVVKTYTTEQSVAGGIGTLRQSKDASPFNLRFIKYQEGKSLAGASELGNHWLGYPKEFKMAPGEYTIMVECFTQNTYSFPVLRIHVSAGITYELGCSRTETDVNKVRAFIKNTFES